LKIKFKTIYTDLKRESLLVRRCQQHRDIESEDVQKCPECRDLVIVIHRVRNLSNIIEEATAVNAMKMQKLEDKNDEIELLKQRIALFGDQEDKIVRSDAEQLEFLMRDQIEGSLVPITKLPGVGNYLFGTRKIFVQILENELVVRVGGGYMDIDEFLVRFTDSELTKIQKQIKKEGVKKYEELAVYKEHVVKNNLHLKAESPVFVPILTKDNPQTEKIQ
jgi:hypothetical protein